MQAGAQAGAQVGAQVGAQAGALAFQCNQPHTRTCRRRSRAATLVGATETHDVLASLSAGVVKQSASRILCARGRRTAIAVTRMTHKSRSENLTKHSGPTSLNHNFRNQARGQASKQARRHTGPPSDKGVARTVAIQYRIRTCLCFALRGAAADRLLLTC